MGNEFKVTNIGKGQQNIRYFGAIAFGVLAVGVAVAMVIFGIHPAWRLLLILPVALGAISFFEAREETCALLAARGECSLDDSVKIGKTLRGDRVEDKSMRKELRVKGRRITIKSYGLAAVVVVIFALLPI